MGDSQALLDKLYMLAQIIQDVSDVSDIKAVAPMLTRAQFQLLHILVLGGERTVTELADLLNISRPAISKTVEKLFKHLLVTRSEDPSDRRTLHLGATALGENIIKNYQLKRATRIRDLENHYSSEEMAQFEDMIDRYVERCVALDKGMELICIQCNGQYQTQCGFQDMNGNCSFRLRSKKPD